MPDNPTLVRVSRMRVGTTPTNTEPDEATWGDALTPAAMPDPAPTRAATPTTDTNARQTTLSLGSRGLREPNIWSPPISVGAPTRNRTQARARCQLSPVAEGITAFDASPPREHARRLKRWSVFANVTKANALGETDSERPMAEEAAALAGAVVVDEPGPRRLSL